MEHTNKIGCFLLEFFCVGGKSSVTYTIRYTNYFSLFPSVLSVKFGKLETLDIM